MPFRPPLPWLLLALLSSSLAMTIAAAFLRKLESALAAAVFALSIVAATVVTNIELWRHNPVVPTTAAEIVTPRLALWRNAFLTMLAYLWCGVTMLSIYLGAGVFWQHGWQYGTLMLVIAAGHGLYLYRLADPEDAYATPFALNTVSKLSALQAVAIALALIWLIASGKLETLKGDWAANQIFLAGGFAVLCISMIVVKTHAALMRAGA